jgi:hypothetical protein
MDQILEIHERNRYGFSRAPDDFFRITDEQVGNLRRSQNWIELKANEWGER